MTKKIFTPVLTLILTLSLLCATSFSTLTASAAWYSHSTPATITSTQSLTSPARTYDGNYMAIELTVQPLSSAITYPGGLIVQPIINGVGGDKYYVDFIRNNYVKLDMIPIPNNASVRWKYSIFGSNCYSVTLTNVVSYSWTQ